MAAIKGELHFGQFLQQCRREKEIPLEAVSQITRISVSSLRQIESEDLANLPAPLYVKSFLKAYAQAIGVDPQEALRRYENTLGLQMRNEGEQPQRRQSKPFWPRLILVLVLFAVVIFLTLYVAGLFSSEPDQEPPASTTTEPAQISVAEPADTVDAIVEEPPGMQQEAVKYEEEENLQADVQPPTEPVEAPDRNGVTAESSLQTRAGDQVEELLQLEMTAVEPTWIKAIADGQAPREFSLKPGEQVTIEAKTQFNLLIGNAGGIRLFLDGREIHVPGKSGQVVTMQLP